MDSTTRHRIAVIGGGLSGLATAAKLQLARPQLAISLYEAQSRLGGVINTEHENGFVIDHGADMFATNPPGVLDLCEQLGIASRVIEAEETRRGARIVNRGRLVPVPEGFVLMRATQLAPLLKTPLLSLAGKLRFLAERWMPNKADFDIDESVQDFVLRRMGREALDRLIAPLVAGIYTADIAKLSMQTTMAPLAQMEQEYGSLAKATIARRRSGEDSLERMSTGARYGQFRSFPNGMYELIEGLAAALPADAIHLQTSVKAIEQQEQGWDLLFGENSRHSFDHVVLATPPQAASRLLAQTVPLAAEQLAAIESASTAIVVLGVARDDIKENVETFGFVVPPVEKRRILAGSFASHKFAGRAPEDHVLIRVFIGGSLQSELLELSDHELIELAQEELQSLIGLAGKPVLAKVVRWTDAMPQYHVGHAEKVRKIEAAIDDTPCLSLTSNVLHGVGIAPVIRQADQTANKVLDSLEG